MRAVTEERKCVGSRNENEGTRSEKEDSENENMKTVRENIGREEQCNAGKNREGQ